MSKDALIATNIYGTILTLVMFGAAALDLYQGRFAGSIIINLMIASSAAIVIIFANIIHKMEK
jgi:hypothetical protein